MIIIGASTGGPGHLRQIFDQLVDVALPPVVIAQHMDPKIIPSLASHLSSSSQRSVHIVSKQTNISTSGLYVCQHTARLLFTDDILGLEVDTCSRFPYNPSIDTLLDSAASLTDRLSIMAILLTGMGDDGALGLLRLYQAGGLCIAESDESATIYGMPKKALEYNPEVSVLPLDQIIKKMREYGASHVV